MQEKRLRPLYAVHGKELESVVVGFLITFFAIHPIIVAALVNVFTSLLSDIYFTLQTKKSPLVLLFLESVVVLVEGLEAVVLVYN